MTARPILFKAEMVRAILEGRKSQTRRTLKPKRGTTFADAVATGRKVGIAEVYEVPVDRLVIPYAAGDLLWVREAWYDWHSQDGQRHFGYAADFSGEGSPNTKFRPSIHMPRLASRITLKVTEVRVQRLQDISARDAAAEGMTLPWWKDDNYPELDMGVESDNRRLVRNFSETWDRINGSGSWEANPWVAAISFERVTQ